jgi:hypothetical protein
VATVDIHPLSPIDINININMNNTATALAKIQSGFLQNRNQYVTNETTVMYETVHYPSTFNIQGSLGTDSILVFR